MNIFFVIFIFFITTRIYKKKKINFNIYQNNQNISNYEIKFRKKSDGFDHRYNKTSDLDIELLLKIHMNLKKKIILEKLKSNSIGIIEKIKIIEQEKIFSYSNNISKNLGKKDFYFDFDT